MVEIARDSIVEKLFLDMMFKASYSYIQYQAQSSLFCKNENLMLFGD